jgi:nucleoside phosphorylase
MTRKEIRPVRLTLVDLLSLGTIGIRTRRMRAALSALGIAVGIATMVAVTSIPESSERALMNELAALGPNLLQVMPAPDRDGARPSLPAASVAMVARIGPVTSVSAVANLNTVARRSDLTDPRDGSGLTVLASRPDLLDTLEARVLSGRFLDRGGFPTVVLGSVAAARLGIPAVRDDGPQLGWLAGGQQVALAVLGSGTAGAAALAERAIAEFGPTALLFVGVAGALKPHLNLGDIVVATKVYGYHGATEEDGQHKARPEVWAASHSLEQHARRVATHNAWPTLIQHTDRSRRSGPQVHFSAIASGEVVLNSRTTTLATQLNRTYNDAVAIEMESAGAAKAAQLNSVPTLTIRGISDKADGGKHTTDRAGWQAIAAANAAAFTAALITQIQLT